MDWQDYHIKHIKTIDGHDGKGFSGILFIGKKRLGTVIDHNDGAPILIEIKDEDRNAMNAYVKTLPPYTCSFNDPNTGKPAIIDICADFFVGGLADQAFNRKIR